MWTRLPEVLWEGARDGMVRLGVIGGSGLYDLDGLELVEQRQVETAWGHPSGPIISGRRGDLELLFLPRHGVGHVLNPSEVPYRANVAAMKKLGATHLLAVSAVGSLTEQLPPKTLVCPDQIIDRTVGRSRTFFEDGVAGHVGLADPFDAALRRLLIDAATSVGTPVAEGGAYVCIEGPQFSTRAESHLYRSWGASVIGMTAMPEARLAREAGLPYAMLAMVTDFDVWHDSAEAVTVEMVIANLHANTAAARAILAAFGALVDRLSDIPPAADPAAAIVTTPRLIPADARRRLIDIGIDLGA